MTQQFIRQLSLVIANSAGEGIEFNQFRCSFNVKRGDFQTPNSLDVRIYNLSNQTANQIAQTEFTQVQLSAGYPGNIGLLFRGTIKQFRQGRIDQKDSYVDITAADGDEAYNFAPIYISVPGGNSQSQIASVIQAALAKASKNQTITVGYQPELPTNAYPRGKVMYGMARDEAREFAWSNNCKWSIQDGAFTLIPFNSYIPGASVPTISVSTGLIGVPEQTQQGINIKTLLNPNIKIGQLIKLDSQVNQFRFGLDFPSQATNPLLATSTATNQQGLYYVMVANHTGDTRGEPWWTEMVCLSVDATIGSADAITSLFAIGPVPINRYGQ